MHPRTHAHPPPHTHTHTRAHVLSNGTRIKNTCNSKRHHFRWDHCFRYFHEPWPDELGAGHAHKPSHKRGADMGTPPTIQRVIDVLENKTTWFDSATAGAGNRHWVPQSMFCGGLGTSLGDYQFQREYVAPDHDPPLRVARELAWRVARARGRTTTWHARHTRCATNARTRVVAHQPGPAPRRRRRRGGVTVNRQCAPPGARARVCVGHTQH